MLGILIRIALSAGLTSYMESRMLEKHLLQYFSNPKWKVLGKEVSLLWILNNFVTIVSDMAYVDVVMINAIENLSIAPVLMNLWNFVNIPLTLIFFALVEGVSLWSWHAIGFFVCAIGMIVFGSFWQSQLGY